MTNVQVKYQIRRVYQYFCNFNPVTDKIPSQGEKVSGSFIMPRQIGSTEVYDSKTNDFLGIIDAVGQFIPGEKNEDLQFVCDVLNQKTNQLEKKAFDLADAYLTDLEHTPGIRLIVNNMTSDWKSVGDTLEYEITELPADFERENREKALSGNW